VEFADRGDAGHDGKREANRRPDGPDLVTCLIADVDESAGGSPVDQVREIALASGGEVELGPELEPGRHPPGRRLVTAVFHSAGDATHAALGIARSARPARMVLVTGADGRRTGQPSTRARAAALLAHVTQHQVMTVAPTAIMAGRKLPRGAELIDRGSLRLGRGIPAERVYELRLGPGLDGEDPGDDDDLPASNLEWARRAADGLVEGFDDNRDVLLGAWRAARDGNPRMVLLRGECGNGRTSVAADLALRVHAEGASVLYGRWDAGVGGPCQAIREALGVYADGCSGQRLRADLEGWAGEIGRLLPDVGTRIGARLVPLPAAAPGAVEDEPVRLFEAVEAWLRAIARRHPTLLVLDDVHRADPTSLQLLDHVRHARAVLPLLTVVTVSLPDLEAGDSAEAFATVFDDPDAADLDTIDLP
jgi:hypothetical protein